jgi:hypothetical protein
MERVIYVVDVGSPKGGLAWARLEDQPKAIPTGSANFEWAATRIARDLRAGVAVALGFEAPGCIPVPADATLLAKARTGEVREGQSRPWSYGAGAYVTTMAIQLGAWLLREINAQLGTKDPPKVTFDPSDWPETTSVLLWEAFVSGPGHARKPNSSGVSKHIQDAATAAKAFQLWWSTRPRPPSAVSCDPRIATFGAVALWARWTADIAILSQEPVVLWPDQPFGEDVVPDSSVPDAVDTSRGVSSTDDVDAIEDDATNSAAILSVACGDSYSLWRSHQTKGQLAEFDLLSNIVGASSSQARRCDVSFDGGTTWHALTLRRISENQISWRGYDAHGTSDSRVTAVVRI